MSGGAAKVVLGMAVPKPEAGKPVPRTVEAVLFADVADEGGGVRAWNFARGIARSIMGDGDEILEGWPPEEEFAHLWRITLRVEPSGPRSAGIDMDYLALPGCPLDQRQQMMGFVAALRGAMREGRKARRG